METGQVGRRTGIETDGAVLDHLADAVALHDRRVPGTQAYIDHIAIGPAGVYVIEVRTFTGRIEKRDVGSWLFPDERLYVGGRERTKLLAGVQEHCDLVRTALADLADTPVHGVLCFVGSEWPHMRLRPIRLGPITCIWPRGLRKLVATSGSLSAGDIALRAARLTDALAPA